MSDDLTSKLFEFANFMDEAAQISRKYFSFQSFIIDSKIINPQ